MSAASFARVTRGDDIANARRVRNAKGTWLSRADVDNTFQTVHGRSMTDDEWDECVDAAAAMHRDAVDDHDERSPSTSERTSSGPTIRIRGAEIDAGVLVALAEGWILQGYGTTESEVARRLATGAALLRYCPTLGWFIWSNHVWERASADAARSRVRQEIRFHITAALGAAKIKHARCSKSGECSDDCQQMKSHAKAMRVYDSARALGSVLTEMRTHPEILVDDPALFDAHPHLLNCPNGVVDLRDGTLSEAKPDLLLTKMAGASYVPGATHEDWTQALDALSGLDTKTQAWLQRYLGSGASGHTLTDSLNVFLHGNGNNGKSTILGAIDSALGNYAGSVPDAVLATGSNHEQRIAMLSFRGLRFALMEETSEDMRLATTAIKKLSSGNSVSARVLNQGNIEFPASHTLVIATNHTPYVRESDKGTWRRLVLVPFTKDYTSGPEEHSDIRERMIDGEDGRAEAVLAWLVAGCAAWYESKRRLTPLPAQLSEATAEWRADSDLVGDFLSSQVTMTGDDSDRSNKGDLYAQFNGWCEMGMNKNPYGSQRGFNAAVKNHEFAAGQISEQRGTAGVKQWGGVRSLSHSLVTVEETCNNRE